MQRRVDQPDRHRQAVHLPEDAPRSRSRCNGSSSSSAASAFVAGAGQDQPLDQFAPFAEEHVLGAAQADALRAEPAGPGGVRRRCRRWSAPPAAACRRRGVSIRCTAATSTSASGLPVALEVLHHRGRLHRHLAEVDAAGGAVDGDDVALVDGPAVHCELSRATSTSSVSAPQTHVLPMPRATTAACDVLPPRLVRMPCAAIMPGRSSGLVSRRTRITFSPSAAQLDRPLGVEDRLADRRAGRGADAARDRPVPLGTGRRSGTSAAPAGRR